MTVKRNATVKLNFTKRALEDLPKPTEGRAVYYDEKCRGLGLKIEVSDRRSFFWFRKVRGTPTWKTLGDFPALSVDDARQRADERNAALAQWKSGGWAGPSPFERPRTEPTLTELVEAYAAKHLQKEANHPEKAEAALRWYMEKYVPAAVRQRPLGEITREKMRGLQTTTGEKHGHYTANSLMENLRALFNFAYREEMWHGENPTKHISPYPEKRRERYLSVAEVTKLGQALRRAPNPDLPDFVSLALWTGARKMDVLGMRWQDVSLDDNRWVVPTPKGGKPYTVPLTPEAIEILRARWKARKLDTAWVFPSHGTAGHVVDLKGAWKALLKDAGLYSEDRLLCPRIHDLRRTQGSWQARQGTSLIVIGKSLGHNSLASAQPYAQINVDPVREAMAPVNAAMAAAMRKKPQPQLPAAAALARRGKKVRRG